MTGFKVSDLLSPEELRTVSEMTAVQKVQFIAPRVGDFNARANISRDADYYLSIIDLSCDWCFGYKDILPKKEAKDVENAKV